jgi:hypothetical protein
MCIRCLHGSTRTRSRIRAPITRSRNIASGSVTQAEIGNLLENFKTDILGTLTTQLDVLQVKQKQAEEEHLLAIFFPRCRRKHGSRECPLDVVQNYAIFAQKHATEQCPSILGLKFIFKEEKEEIKLVYLMAQCHQW